MDLANKEGGIVVGTGDLSELALGFATFAGDHIAMYNVNASVPKTLVRRLVRWVAEHHASAAERDVLVGVLETPVSPELVPPGERRRHRPAHRGDRRPLRAGRLLPLLPPAPGRGAAQDALPRRGTPSATATTSPPSAAGSGSSSSGSSTTSSSAR